MNYKFFLCLININFSMINEIFNNIFFKDINENNPLKQTIKNKIKELGLSDTTNLQGVINDSILGAVKNIISIKCFDTIKDVHIYIPHDPIIFFWNYKTRKNTICKKINLKHLINIIILNSKNQELINNLKRILESPYNEYFFTNLEFYDYNKTTNKFNKFQLNIAANYSLEKNNKTKDFYKEFFIITIDKDNIKFSNKLSDLHITIKKYIENNWLIKKSKKINNKNYKIYIYSIVGLGILFLIGFKYIYKNNIRLINKFLKNSQI